MKNPKSKIMIVEDEFIAADATRRKLEDLGYTVSSIVASGKKAIEKAEQDKPDLVLMDIELKGDMDGVEAAKIIASRFNIPIIYTTAFSSEQILERAKITEPYGYIIKPFDNRQIHSNIEMALYKHRSEAEKLALKKEVDILHTFIDSSLENLLGVSNAIKKINHEIQKIARSDFSIIIQGETGTGKTTLAREIHNLSNRSSKPFIKVDIGTLSESLIESELFGHEEGSFTGANRRKKGFFEITNGGTIFIDEIENMAQSTQTKLLNVIEEKKIYLVGSSKQLEVDFRTISATNSDLETLVKEKKIRQDFYYRLAEYVVSIPPLRERPEDIRFFAQKFLAYTIDELDLPLSTVNDDAMNILMSYSWPGNIRELKNVVKKLVLFSKDGVINEAQVNSVIRDKQVKDDSSVDMSLKEAMKFQEKNIIIRAMKITQGNKSRAASILKTSYRNLLTKIKEYDL